MSTPLTRVAMGLVLALCAGIGGHAAAAPPAARVASTVVASEAWIRLPPPAANVAAGYVELHNGGAPTRLLAAHAAGFGQVQLHAMRMDGEMMRMQAVPDGLALPAGQTTSLQPGGYHLMLMMPKRPLQAGQHVRVRLQFAGGVEQSLDFVVRDGMGGQTPGHGVGR